MNDLKQLLKKLQSSNTEEIYEALSNLSTRTKSLEEVYNLFEWKGFDVLYSLLLRKNQFPFYAKLLSIFANCTNLDARWRKAFFEKDGVTMLVDQLSECSDNDIISRMIRLIANMSKHPKCLYTLQQNKFILHALVKHANSDHSKCQHSSLRALRILCASKKSTQIVAENDQFPIVLMLINCDNSVIVMLCLRMICEMLKTQVIEICYRVIDADVLPKIILLANNSQQDVKDICLEIIYLLTLNSSCRVTVAMEGAIELFTDRLKEQEHGNPEIYKYATRGLCLCSREAVSRNKMKLAGSLPALVKVLQQDKLDEFRESIVASFVCFLFDDSSLGLLIRADVIPALLKYLDYLTTIEHNVYKEKLKKESEESEKEKKDCVNVLETEAEETNQDQSFTMPLSDSISLSYHESYETQQALSPETFHSALDSPIYQGKHLNYSSPETSPYNPNSPQYSLPSFSPHMSPSYSPPTSPPRYSQLSPENYGDGYFSETSNDTSANKKVPYHFQSADGIHAMIHGTRGPIHDTLLLLSRFSQAKDPSSFFLFLPGFNSVLNYILLVEKPIQKCARILNRLTLNSHCFDIMLKKKLIPRLYIRLCTGYSLEYLSSLLKDSQEDYHMRNCTNNETSNADIISDNIEESFNEKKNTFEYMDPSTSTLSLGKLLVSNLRSLCESSYGKGVLTQILLTGSKELKENCVLSMPYMIWSLKLQKRIFKDLKAAETLCDLLALPLLSADNTNYILTVEALCSLARSIVKPKKGGDKKQNYKFGVVNLSPLDHEYEPPTKRRKANSADKSNIYDLTFKLNSGRFIKCKQSSLVQHSLLFERMLSNRYVDVDQPFISITDVDDTSFIKMLHYLHGCSIAMNSSCSRCKQCSYDEEFEYDPQDNNSSENVVHTSHINNVKLVDITQRPNILPQSANNTAIKEGNLPVGELIEAELEGDKMDTKFKHAATLSDISSESCSKTLPIKAKAYQDTPTNINSLSNYFITDSSIANVLHLYTCAEKFFVDQLKNACENYLIQLIDSSTLVEILLLAFRHSKTNLVSHCLNYLLIGLDSPKDRVQCFTEILYTQEKKQFLANLKDFILAKVHKL